MATDPSKSILSLATSLRRQKYPIWVILILMGLTLLFNFFSSSHSEKCSVINIYDGDTLTLQCASEKIKVRMYCIDTPEIKQAPWGKQARDHLRSLIGSDLVKLVTFDKDRYHRVVGEVYKGTLNLNLAQVQEGYAAVYTTYCKKSEYSKVENQAKISKKGIWSTSGLHQTPWQWRKEN